MVYNEKCQYTQPSIELSNEIRLLLKDTLHIALEQGMSVESIVYIAQREITEELISIQRKKFKFNQ